MFENFSFCNYGKGSQLLANKKELNEITATTHRNYRQTLCKKSQQHNKMLISLICNFFFLYRSQVDQKNNVNDGKNNQDANNANDKKKPHIKKPLNAFMLYMKEMRAKVVAECTLKESAAINQILGRKVLLLLLLSCLFSSSETGRQKKEICKFFFFKYFRKNKKQLQSNTSITRTIICLP